MKISEGDRKLIERTSVQLAHLTSQVEVCQILLLVYVAAWNTGSADALRGETIRLENENEELRRELARLERQIRK